MFTLLRISSAPPALKALVNRDASKCCSRTFFWWFRAANENEKVDIDKVRFPKNRDHAAGEELIVLKAIRKGIKDPFDLEPQVRFQGTKGNN